MTHSVILLFLLYLVKVRSDDAEANTEPLATVNDGEEPADDAKGDSHWGYEKGTAAWCTNYQVCCGKSQSPIALETKSAKSQSIAKITFNNYDVKPTSLKLKNNGHTVVISMDYAAGRPSISDGGFNGKYDFASFHFHWGSADIKGSEHTLDGTIYPLELHIVHINSKYSSLEEAVGNADGLAVLGIFFESASEHNAILNNVIENLENVKYLNSEVSLSGSAISLKLSDLLPSSTDAFFRYAGSLTTPSCQESVTWTMFQKTEKLSSDQLSQFRKLFTGLQADVRSLALIDNFRPPQPLNDRPVQLREASGSVAYRDSMLMVSIAGLISFYLH